MRRKKSCASCRWNPRCALRTTGTVLSGSSAGRARGSGSGKPGHHGFSAHARDRLAMPGALASRPSGHGLCGRRDRIPWLGGRIAWRRTLIILMVLPPRHVSRGRDGPLAVSERKALVRESPAVTSEEKRRLYGLLRRDNPNKLAPVARGRSTTNFPVLENRAALVAVVSCSVIRDWRRSSARSWRGANGRARHPSSGPACAGAATGRRLQRTERGSRRPNSMMAPGSRADACLG